MPSKEESKSSATKKSTSEAPSHRVLRKPGWRPKHDGVAAIEEPAGDAEPEEAPVEE